MNVNLKRPELQRTPFGQIENTLSPQLNIKQTSMPISECDKIKDKLSTFYNECRNILDKNQREMHELLSSIYKENNKFLIDKFKQKEVNLEKIKQKFSIQLAELTHYSFIDKKLFSTNRTTGEIEVKLNSDSYVKLAEKDKIFSVYNLKGLKLNGVILTQPQIVQIVQTLPHLEELNLYECAIDSEGVKIIARGLPCLTKLQLQWNQISNEGATQISKNLKKLNQLNLYLNDIGDQGGKNLVDNLKGLKTLNLSNNQISQQMQKYICSAINSNNIV